MRGTAHRRNTDRPCEIPPDITIAVEPNRSHPTRLTKLAERKTVISTVPATPRRVSEMAIDVHALV
jgi:hypothetical protein